VSPRASGSLLTLAVLLILSVPAAGQTVEIVPLGGYRFGNDLFEVATNSELDLDGAPVVGGVFDVAISEGLWFEALFTRQEAHAEIQGDAFRPRTRIRAVVDQWLAGGRQDFGRARARPFLTGLLGLTHYRAEGDDEVRFTVRAGGGVELPLQRRIGVRLEGRVFATFVNFDARAVACASGTCLLGLDVNVVWQAEFTAGLALVF
jgi:hypothetical protein